jgi:chromosome segregation ATPase
LIKTLKADIAELERNKSELRTELIETEQRLEQAQYDMRAQIEREVDSYRKKFVECEARLADQRDEVQRVQALLDQSTRRMADCELTARTNENQLTELANRNAKLNNALKQSKEEIVESQKKLCSLLVEKEAVMKSM